MPMRLADEFTKMTLAAWAMFAMFPCAAVAQTSTSIDSAALNRCLPIAGSATAEERQFGEELRNALQNSATGQRLLRALLTDCAPKGPLVIETSGFKGSFIFNDRGVENIEGERGRGDGERSPRVFYYNKLFLMFKNHAAGVSFASSVLAQEIMRMVVHGYLLGSLDGYKDVLGFCLVEDQYARVKGYMVAYESSDAVTGATLEAADFINTPQVFLDRLKLRFSYALTLQQRELRDPLGTYEKRIQGLNVLAEEIHQRRRSIPNLLDELDHALHSHLEQLGSLAEPVKLLQDQLTLRLQALPNESEETRRAINNLTDMTGILRGVTGQATLRKLQALSVDPGYAGIQVDYSTEVKALQTLMKSKDLRKPDERHTPIPEEKFRELFEKLHPGSPNPPWDDSGRGNAQNLEHGKQ